jgi:tetratricopeptide (TPR) repeat protein
VRIVAAGWVALTHRPLVRGDATETGTNLPKGKKMRKPMLLTMIAVMAVLVVAGTAGAGEPTTITSLDEAKSLSADRGQPILIGIGPGLCESCNKFDQALQKDEKLQDLLKKHVVLCAIDAKEGVGVEVARTYSVPDYQVLSFILTNSDGDVMDRWLGYWDTENFSEHLLAAVENPITVRERMDRFQENPTEIDARKLAELRDFEGYYAEAVAYYRRAQALNPSSEANYDLLILGTMAHGTHGHLFAYADAREQADRVVASGKTEPKHLLKTAGIMGKVAKQADEIGYYTPYLAVAFDRTEGIEDEHVKKMRTKLRADYALHIEKNVQKAIDYKKEAFAQAFEPKDWTQNANMLNNLAWWCFENKINLNEAESLARQGIELAKPGNEKANILDTLAEICNVKGDCGDAVEYIRLAVTEDPENEYFQRQLVRFESLLAAQAK